MKVTKATGDALSHLEEAVNGFDGGIGKSSFQEGDNAAPMFLNAFCQLAEGLEPTIRSLSIPLPVAGPP
jgi:hypothetical protein